MRDLTINYKIFYYIAIFGIFLVPLLGFYDFLMSIGIIDGIITHSRKYNPYRNLIVIKDLLSLFILFMLSLSFFSRGKMFQITLILLILALFPFVTSDSFAEIIAGVRESICLVYIALGIAIVRYGINDQNIDVPLKGLVRSIKLVLLIELCMAILQIFLMPSYDGLTFFGPRVLGSFVNPNALSMYAVISIIFIHLLSQKKMAIIHYHIISLWMIFAAGSRGGILCLFLFYCYILYSSLKTPIAKIIAVVFGIGIFFLLIYNINLLSSKPSGISFINDARIIAFFNYSSTMSVEDFFTGQGWGWGTSWYKAIVPVRGIDYAADSFITSIVIQIGFVFSLLYITLLSYIFLQGGKKGLFLLIILMAIGLQINILEFYPIINILFLLIGVLVGLCRDSMYKKINLIQYKK